MDYKQLAAVILEKVGGKENVDKVLHCATRLRFTLKDVDKADTDALKKTKGVLSVINAGGQYQVVIGPDVPQVYQEVVALGNFEIAKPVDAPADEPKKKQSKLSSVLEYIASMFQPIIPAITGAGLLKALMALGTVTGLLDSASQTYIILNAIADSAFYFLPILLGSSAAKTFKCNQYVAMALGGVLVYPGFVELINAAKDAGTSVSLFGLPVTLASYSSSVVPILLGVWFMSVIEHAVQKISPKAVKFFTVPLASLLAAGVVTILALGPLGTWIGNLIAAFFSWLNANAGWAVPTLVGALNPLLVMTGTHYGLIPIGINNLATAGFDTVVGPGMLTSNVAQGAAGLAVGLRTRNKDTKQLAMSAGLTGVLGITGVESAEAVRGLVAEVQPALVLALPALASRPCRRGCAPVQLSDTGLIPRPGVGNHLAALNRETLGVPVFAVGIPTVVDAATLAADLLEESGLTEVDEEKLRESRQNLMVTPRDIDQQVRDLSKVVGYGINWALQDLEIEEINGLLS